jgi:hypothetical protein
MDHPCNVPYRFIHLLWHLLQSSRGKATLKWQTPQNSDFRILGLHLVSTLVEHQLRGSIDLKREGGTQFCMRFNEVRYKKRI